MASKHLIVVEGTDGSGKSTQQDLLAQRLTELGIKFRRVRFPRYGQRSCALVEMYLGGEFGSHPGDVNPYASSSFYAVDRFASYTTDWKQDYENGVLILCDRYTTSNAVHQAEKLEGEERIAFLDWLFDFEYNKIGLPAPDRVFFLDMPSHVAFDLIGKRQGDKGDIHELDHAYLEKCRESALELCDRYGWNRVQCAPDNQLRTVEEINDELLRAVLDTLKS